jgi:hypothetical protein
VATRYNDLVAIRWTYLMANRSLYLMSTKSPSCGWRIQKIQLCNIKKSNPLLYPLRYIFQFFTFHYLAFNSLLVIFLKVFYTFQLFYLEFFLFWYIFTLFTFLLQMKVHLCMMSWVSTHLRTRMNGTSLGLLLALVEFKGWLFNYLDIG